jgi:hypothetical protein
MKGINAILGTDYSSATQITQKQAEKLKDSAYSDVGGAMLAAYDSEGGLMDNMGGVRQAVMGAASGVSSAMEVGPEGAAIGERARELEMTAEIISSLAADLKVAFKGFNKTTTDRFATGANALWEHTRKRGPDDGVTSLTQSSKTSTERKDGE